MGNDSERSERLCGVFVQDYLNHMNQVFTVYSIHQKGFSWDDWHVGALTNDTCSEYLKSTEYCAMHPMNGSFSHWIDDKLTLKYLCVGTVLDQYMPKYYFQVTEEGKVLPLSDAPRGLKNEVNVSAVSLLLKQIGELAIKRVAGSLGEGFCKAEYKDGVYFLNGKEYTQEALEEEFASLKNYLITEYLHPHPSLAVFCPDTVNCLRYLVGRDENGEMKLIKSYIRFGTKASGFVENYGAGGVLCFISEDGHFEEGNLLDMKEGKNRVLEEHPDTQVELVGEVPYWAEVQKAADLFGETLPQMSYLGIDFVVTDKNEVKVLEINSLTSLDTMQMKGAILKEAQGEFFRRRMKR